MKKRLIFDISYETARRIPISSGDFRDRNIRFGYPPHPVGDLLAGTGGDYKKWPDFMKCGGDVTFIVSGKVVYDLHSNDIAVEVGPVILTCAVGPLAPPPAYFYLCAPNGIEMDEDKNHLSPSIPVKLETWSGADFCTSATRPKMLFCSYRVLELAREKKWTNASFTLPLGVLPNMPHPIRNIDYMAKKKDWPPTWLKELL